MSLLALQRDFRDAIRAETVPDEAGMTIYHNAYRVQLTDCLAETFARTLAWIGGDAFVEAARDHIERTPPRGWTLSDYGDGFDVTLAKLYPDDPEVAELALIEWMLCRAFESEDAEPMPIESIAAIDWDNATLAFVPSLRCIAATTNAGAILSALAADEPPPIATPLHDLARIWVWRQNFIPCFRVADSNEQIAIDMMIAGARFATLCETMVALCGEADGLAIVGTLLGRWFADGLVLRTEIKTGE